MCVTCKIPLNVAESPQANRERAYIQELIDEGLDEGPDQACPRRSVRLHRPRPAAGQRLRPDRVPCPRRRGWRCWRGLLTVLLVRWRRRGADSEADPEPTRPLSAGEASRLDADLSRFDR